MQEKLIGNAAMDLFMQKTIFNIHVCIYIYMEATDVEIHPCLLHLAPSSHLTSDLQTVADGYYKEKIEGKVTEYSGFSLTPHPPPGSSQCCTAHSGVCTLSFISNCLRIYQDVL